MIKGGARFRKKKRPGAKNKNKLMVTRGGVLPKPRPRKRK
jgi:hypothetical protein